MKHIEKLFSLVVPFSEISLSDLKKVGGKNASLGEMYKQLSSEGINIPDGFAVTSLAYWDFLERNNIKEDLTTLISQLDRKDFSNLHDVGMAARNLIETAVIPDETKEAIIEAYNHLCESSDAVEVAVRSSATAEDLPSTSFAGQHDSFLNIKGEDAVLTACLRCYASLFNDRAIKYREDNGFDHMSVALSVGVQKMVRSDLACAGIMFTLDPESGFKNVIHITGVWGLGENIVQGTVIPDEYYIFKPTLIQGKDPIISRHLGSKAKTMVYADYTDHQISKSVVNVETLEVDREQFVLFDDEIITLSKWALLIEEHYKMPMDIEWAKDGISGKLYIVQARPETAHVKKQTFKHFEYFLKGKGKQLVSGSAVGNKIVTGIARVLRSPKEWDKIKEGEILVTENTNPDWNAIMKKSSAIITNKGGRTSHAAIVAREIGIAAIVGTENATEVIKDGQAITVACQEGKTCYVYDKILPWEKKEFDFTNIQMPTHTQPMLILADPDTAYKSSFYPNNGVGLVRMEFIINNTIKVHPMALVEFDELFDEKAKQKINELTRSYTDRKEYFVDQLSQGIATTAAAFYPKDVIVRMSDFKTNEYANLIGGSQFEPHEENPMIGFRGASRYYNKRYKEGFHLECEAIKRVRNEMGLTNVKMMVPFCRTVEEGKKVLKLMEEFGLKQKENGLEIYMMVEVPSNVVLADEFAKIFDGFSIGSNDLTQLTLGVDRDSALVSDWFNEQNEAVTKLITQVITAAKRNKIKIGLCGQAPSDNPEFAKFLVKSGIDSISFNLDALLKGIENINIAENASR